MNIENAGEYKRKVFDSLLYGEPIPQKVGIQTGEKPKEVKKKPYTKQYANLKIVYHVQMQP